jgi:hypothetical protein
MNDISDTDGHLINLSAESWGRITVDKSQNTVWVDAGVTYV